MIDLVDSIIGCNVGNMRLFMLAMTSGIILTYL